MELVYLKEREHLSLSSLTCNICIENVGVGGLFIERRLNFCSRRLFFFNWLLTVIDGLHSSAISEHMLYWHLGILLSSQLGKKWSQLL